MGKNSTVIYHSYVERFKKLSDAQFGALIRAALCYDRTGEYSGIGDERVSDAFEFIKFDIDTNRESYERVSRARAEAGQKGGKTCKRPSGKQGKQNKQLPALQTNQDDTDSDTESDPEGDVPVPRAPDALFADFWHAYPRKVAKADAMKAFYKLKPDEQLLTAMILAVGKQKNTAEWTKDGGQYIPHPATWLNGRRWEDEDAPPRPKAPDTKQNNAQSLKYMQRTYTDGELETLFVDLSKDPENNE